MLIVVAILLLLLLPSPWDLVGFIVVLVLWVGELFLWNRTVKRHRRAVGAETLIGADAEVVSPCRPVGQVRVNGELWAARSEGGADVGDSVHVVERERLTLRVERVPDSAQFIPQG